MHVIKLSQDLESSGPKSHVHSKKCESIHNQNNNHIDQTKKQQPQIKTDKDMKLYSEWLIVNLVS